MQNKLLLTLASTIFAFSVADSQAKTPTPEEVDKIVAVLKVENCEIIVANVKGTNFEVDAACADEKSYTFTLDQNFKVLGKKADKN
jgi:hypothetical protein